MVFPAPNAFLGPLGWRYAPVTGFMRPAQSLLRRIEDYAWRGRGLEGQCYTISPLNFVKQPGAKEIEALVKPLAS